MKVRIYQIVPEEETLDILFCSLEETLEKGPIRSDCYECVYEGEFQTMDPEDIYVIFNTNLPSDYHGRSLSVSDIVELERDGICTFFFCDSVGFQPVSFDRNAVRPTAECRKQK